MSRALYVLILGAFDLAACRAYDRSAYNALLDAPREAARFDVADAADTTLDVGDAPRDAPVANPDAPDASGCDPYVLPTRPGALNDADGGTRVTTFALRRVLFGFASQSIWGQRGFDRDGLCTNPAVLDSGVACRPRGSTPAPDGERGRDNAFASNLGALIGTRWSEREINDSIDRGRTGIGIRLSYYGGPDDAQLRFEWLPLALGRAAGGGPPAFDGNDVWSVNAPIAYDRTEPTLALVRTDNAFASGGVLVAPLASRAPIRFPGDMTTIRLTLSGGRFVGPVGATGMSLGPLEYSGVWPLSDAYADVATLGFCPPPPADRATTWSFLQSALDNAADLLSTLEVSPGLSCDAISVAFQSEWVPITLGPDTSFGGTVEGNCGGDAGVDSGD